ncbi:MAG: recombination mediator RecR [Candidatus Omnitrophota bacterium]
MGTKNGLPESLLKLIECFRRLPGIGPKSAQRLAFFVLKSHNEYAQSLIDAVNKVKQTVRFCKICNNLSDEDICYVCNDQSRDRSTICVVEEPNDVMAIERMGTFKGVYHVLLGALSPLDGIGPQDLRITGLLNRIRQDKPKEVIIATDPDTEGETTALYLARLFKGKGVKLTRLAYGVPVGGDLEYADQATLIKAIDGRRELS